MTRIEDLTSQIDGVKDTFTTTAAFEPSTVTIGYNGQVYPPGLNIASFPDVNEVQLEFVPTYDADVDMNSKLMVIYEELNDATEDIVGSANPPGTF